MCLTFLNFFKDQVWLLRQNPTPLYEFVKGMFLQLPFVKKSHRRYSFPIITSDHSLHVSAENKTQSPHPELKGLRCNPEPSPCWQKSSVIIPTLLKTHEEKAKKHDLSDVAAMEIRPFPHRPLDQNRPAGTAFVPQPIGHDSVLTSVFVYTCPCVHEGRGGGGKGNCIYFLALFIIYLMQTKL